MSTFYLIRHGKPDYTYGDTHGFIDKVMIFAPKRRKYKRCYKDIKRC